MGVNKTALKSPSGLLKIVALVRKNYVLEGPKSADIRRFASSRLPYNQHSRPPFRDLLMSNALNCRNSQGFEEDILQNFRAD